MTGLIFLGLDSLFDLKLIKGAIFSNVMMLLTVSVIINLQAGLLMQGYRAAEKYARGEWILNSIKLGEFSALAAGLYLGCHAVTAALIIVGGQSLSLFIMRWDLNRKVPWLTYGFEHVSIPVIRRLLKPSLMFMGFPFGHAMWQQGTLMVVANVLGAGAVVPFSAVRTMVHVIQQGTGVINAAFWPELSRAIGKHDMPLSTELYRLAMRATFWAASMSGLVLVFFGSEIVTLWTLNKVNADPLFVWVMVAVVWIRCFWSTSAVVLKSSNAHSVIAVIYVAGSFAAVVSSLFIAAEFGLVGVAVALLTVELVVTKLIFWCTNRFLSVSGWSVCRHMLFKR
jgi:O-antigen/teichoic acid export membrane protein